MSEQQKFETWAIVEIMGHSKYAGLVTEQAIGGCSFVRVDVPEINDEGGDGRPAFTKLFGQSSIFCLTPCTEEAARSAAKSLRARAMTVFGTPSTTPQIGYDPDDDYPDDDDGEDDYEEDDRPENERILDYLDDTRQSAH